MFQCDILTEKYYYKPFFNIKCDLLKKMEMLELEMSNMF